MRLPAAILAASTLLLLVACGGEPTPEARVRAYIDQVAESAQTRQLRDFDDYLTEDYEDERGLTKQEVLAIVTRYILANQRIYVFKRVAEVRIDDPAHAHAVVYAAMAGQPVSAPEDLARINADIYRFEIDLVADANGQYRVIRGAWRPAGPEALQIGQ
jgi:hypothetical protein